MTDDPEPKGKRNQPKRNYEVGKGKPPKGSQFPPGVSGNPSGRPIRPPKLQKTMAEILARDITLTVNGQKKMMSMQEAIVLSLTTKAIKGTVKDQLGVIELIRLLEGQAPFDLNSMFDD